MKLLAILFCLVSFLPVNSQNKNISFTPTNFSNVFTLNREPVLRIQSGDTVSTETIDAAGYDSKGVKRQKGGNPLTGPFYVEGSATGDVLAITITKCTLNRNTAFTTEVFASRSLPKSILLHSKHVKIVTWQLDKQSGVAVLNDTAYPHLQSFRIPLRPFIGCIGVAPDTKKNEILSFFQGNFGGNLDFEKIAAGSTIYLPVLHDGAYLYFGDGHALEGDGEIAGNALETSLDIQFTVRVLKNQTVPLSQPRVEDSTHIMSIGVAKSLDDAIKSATAGLLEWVQKDYQLSYAEATQVLSTSIEYSVAEIADPYVEVVAKLKKNILQQLKN